MGESMQAITLPAISSTMSGQFSGIDESMQGRLSPTMSLPMPVSTSLEFPSMDSLQAALPPAMPWSNTVPQYPLPPNSTSGARTLNKFLLLPWIQAHIRRK